MRDKNQGAFQVILEFITALKKEVIALQKNVILADKRFKDCELLKTIFTMNLQKFAKVNVYTQCKSCGHDSYNKTCLTIKFNQNGGAHHTVRDRKAVIEAAKKRENEKEDQARKALSSRADGSSKENSEPCGVDDEDGKVFSVAMGIFAALRGVQFKSSWCRKFDKCKNYCERGDAEPVAQRSKQVIKYI